MLRRTRNRRQAGQTREAVKRMDAFLELVNSAYLSYEIGKAAEKRDLVKMMTSNFLAEEKSVLVKLETPFELMAERPAFTSGGAQREAARTFRHLFIKIFTYFKNVDIAKINDSFLENINPKKELGKYNYFSNSGSHITIPSPKRYLRI